MTYEDKLLKEFYEEHGRYPGELWTPLHTVTAWLFMVGIVTTIITIVLEAITS